MNQLILPAADARYALFAHKDRMAPPENPKLATESAPGSNSVKMPARGVTERRRVAGIRTHDYLKARLLYVRQDFDEVLDKLTDAGLRWRPADDMPSVAGLLVEMANKEKELIAWLQSGEWPNDDPDAFKETSDARRNAFGFRNLARGDAALH